MKFQMFKLNLEKAEEPEIKLPTSIGSSKNLVPEKYLLLLYWLCQSLWLYGLQQTVGNSSRDGNTRPLDQPPENSVCRSSNNSLELDMEQQTGSKSGKEYMKDIYCHPAYLTSMQSTSWEMLDWMKQKLESRLPGEISITSDMQMTPPLWQKVKRNWRASWWKWKRRVKNLA